MVSTYIYFICRTIDYKTNLGEGKDYPGGPKCPTYVSKSGRISGKILVQILLEFDKIDLFPRVPGVISMLVIDCHKSRLDPIFIEYISDVRHR